jgi:hypothetical protein
MTGLVLLARGAYAGLALFGATVMALGGASSRLVVGFWAAGSLGVAVNDLWTARRMRRGAARRVS